VIFSPCSSRHQSVADIAGAAPLAAPPHVMWHHLHLALLHCSFTSVHQTKLISRSTAWLGLGQQA